MAPQKPKSVNSKASYVQHEKVPQNDDMDKFNKKK